MSGPLAAAWEWYRGVYIIADSARRVAHLWDGLRDVVLPPEEAGFLPTGDQLDAEARTALHDLDDIAVLHLFATFETLVREDVSARIDAERAPFVPNHPLLVGAMTRLDRLLKLGNVSELIDSYDAGADAKLKALLAEVREVREYRNWVAHGRRGEQPQLSVDMTPAVARDRLEDFLLAVRAVPPA